MPNSLGKNNKGLSTKKRIADALYSLIQEIIYDDITIYHILNKANVSRRTFYRYFCSKDDLMNFCLDIFIEEYLHEREHFLIAQRPEEVFKVTLHFMYNKRDLITALIRSGHYQLIVRKFNSIAPEIFDEFALPWNHIDDIPSKDSKYISRGLIGAYLNIMLYWLSEDEPLPPEIIAQDMVRLFSAIPLHFPEYLQPKKNLH